MNDSRLHVGIDFSQKQAAVALLLPDGQPLDRHRAFANSAAGYAQAQRYLLDALHTSGLAGLDISGEATNYYGLPFFLRLAHDPDLAAQEVQLFLLNPRWVHWFKKCFAPDDKTDATDPFYIAERTRTRRPPALWQPQTDWLPLRFYTRLRFHLAQALTREKNFAHVYLFLQASAYHRTRPFSNTFGATSRRVLTALPALEALTTQPLQELANLLDAWSGHHLPDPLDNARKLQQVAAESFPLEAALVQPVQRVLDLTLQHIADLEAHLAQVEQWIAEEVQAHHPEVLNLATVLGIGPVLASGIAAEIGDLTRFFQGQKWDKKRHRFRAKNLRDVEDAVAKLAGLWWPRADSGDFVAEDRHLAKSGNRYLRYYLIEAADGMRRYLPEYAAFYARKYHEATKHQHKRALVLTARKSVGLMVGLLHRHEAYRPQEG
jgi:transposase